MPTRVIIDFDSTVVQVEALDELARIALQGKADRDSVLAEIERLTREGMSGKIGFGEALSRRLALFAPSPKQIEKLIELLKKRVTPSFREHIDEIREMTSGVYIVSGGFREYIVPVVAEFGIDAEHVIANSFVTDAAGKIVGADTLNPLAGDNGKVKAVREMKLSGRIIIVGDGFSDLQVAQGGQAHEFVAMTENVSRPEVIREVEHVARDFGEVVDKIREIKFSFPKNKIKVLLLESIHPEGVERLREEGYQVETVAKSLSEEELAERIGDVSILGIRSNTHVTAAVLGHAKHLLAVGAFCIGTNQIDLAGAATRGVAVFNAPFSNTRSVVELAIAEIIALNRRLTDRNTSTHAGEWNKSAVGSHEIRGRRLGIVGYGNIGSQLSVLAEGLGMEVRYFDIADKLSLGNAKRAATMKDLLAWADVVSVHVDGRAANRGLFGETEFAQMKPGAIFLNLSRGMVVDLEALAEHLKSGRITGAAVDVYEMEPKSKGEKFVSVLQGLPNVILTPHVAGSTEESQAAIGRFMAEKLITFINSGSTALSVNLPELTLPQQEGSHRLIWLHHNVPGVLARINTMLAERGVNIDGQFLATRGEVGYVITDINTTQGEEVIKQLREMPETIRLRVLY